MSDVRLYREGLAMILARDPQIEIVAIADVGSAAASIAAANVVLLDVDAAGACEWARRTTSASDAPPVVAFAVGDAEQDVLVCAQAGIVAFAPRDATLEDLIAILKRAVRGEAVCPPRLTAMLFRRLATLDAADAIPTRSTLTPREQDVLDLVARRCSNKEIADRLHVGTSTVKNHVHHILEKLQVRSRHEAAAWAGRHGAGASPTGSSANGGSERNAGERIPGSRN